MIILMSMTPCKLIYYYLNIVHFIEILIEDIKMVGF